ncbi:hypothetical protein CHS0354_020700 [Potamilus streckersoni]|uniref:Uncharacterized protein n=1 Tax=Potamilus streckersoni TaxID=2493646 RepID=A0AAE0TEP1_9BIVA|nr:hypothetical protein CHS0354_020700 [Potamilus streckersoni]
MEITTPANVCHQCYFLGIDGAKHFNRTLLSNSSGDEEDSQDYPPTGLDSDEYDEYDEYGDYSEYAINTKNINLLFNIAIITTYVVIFFILSAPYATKVNHYIIACRMEMDMGAFT